MSRLEHFIRQLHLLFQAHARPDQARQMARYMKDQFPFFGIKGPERKALVSQCWREQGPLPVEDLPALFARCFEQEEREWQYVVNDIGQKCLRQMDRSALPVFEKLIAQRSWWDTVDFLSPKLAGRLLLRYPEDLKPTGQRWIVHPDFWYQRAAILLQLDYKERTDRDLLFEWILLRKDSPEFFVQKAAGWALRQYSRIAPWDVISFIQDNELAPLTRREGLKWLKARGRL